MSQHFRAYSGRFLRFLFLMGDRSVPSLRRSLLLALLLWSGGLHAAETEWIPLDAALKAARGNDRLIFLFIRAGYRDDKKNDEWIAHMDANPGMAHVLAEMITARETPAVAGAILGDLTPFRERRFSTLVLLDSRGALLAQLKFEDYANLAQTLSQYQRMAPAFAASAKARAEGRITESLTIRANALLYAGHQPEALFQEVQKRARAENKEAFWQEAELGLATIASRQRHGYQAMGWFKNVAENPATPELGARAWILYGHERKDINDKRGAIEAYQNAYRLAPESSVFAESARRFMEMMGAEPEAVVKAAVAAGEVRLLVPRRPVLAGDIDVSAAVPPSTASVEFYLDDARVAERTRRPFAAKIRLGAVPRVCTIRVVALDADRAVVGEDSATLNQRAEVLGVEIVSPRDSVVESKTMIELRPHVPDGAQLAGIDLFWNDRKLATFTAPPYRYELTLPKRREFGYIRAVARDASGAMAEDAKVINSEGAAETVQIDAVELQVIVQDGAGRNVEGLGSQDFTVKEDGVPVSVEAHDNANDPITVGLVVDASGSMQVAMASVMEYATEFLRHSLSPGDQTFIVSFSDMPSLYRPLTTDLEHLTASVYDMHATGMSAIWDSVVFGLDQIRGVRGKRALLLFTDGLDNGSRATALGAMQYAQEVGVPVYVVMLYTGGARTVFNSAAGTMIRLPADDDPLKLVAEGSGGVLMKFPRQQDLPKLFQQVRDDTRGAYALTFVSQSRKKRSELRKISVTVPGRRGLVVRAPTAYRPR